MKPAKPTLTNAELHALDLPVVRLLSLGAGLSDDGRTVILSLEYLGQMADRSDTIHLGMAPPAAAQLSRMLEEVVQKYLYDESTLE